MHLALNTYYNFSSVYSKVFVSVKMSVLLIYYGDETCRHLSKIKNVQNFAKYLKKNNLVNKKHLNRIIINNTWGTTIG
jgi:hypothetical protein